MTVSASRLWVQLVGYTILSIVAVCVLIPVGWMFSTAFKTDSEIFSDPPQWIPNILTLDAFTRVWSDYPFLQYFGNSFTVVGTATFISVFFSAFAGYGMARFEFRG